MTVDAALRLSALRRGAPEVLAGADELHRTVRWAHSCEARHVPGLLEGDELLLMTGMGLVTAAADQRAFVRDLVAHRVAAVVIELGHVFRQLPAALVQEARRQRLPLIALHQEVRFVEVTRQLHTAILSRQLTVERRVTELHAALTAMLLDGAGVPAILGALARAVGNPVLLERRGDVVFHAAHEAQAEDLLAHWELLRGRLDAGEPVAPSAPVTAAGARPWGRLVAVPHERPTDALAWSAVERTAPLIALSLARAGEEQLLESRERGNFLHDAMTGRIAPEDMAVRATQLGLTGRHRRMLGVVAARRTHAAGAVKDERRAWGGLRDVREALRASGIVGLLGTRPVSEDLVMLLVVPTGMQREVAVEHVVDAVRGAGPGDRAPGAALTIAAGAIVEDWADVPAAPLARRDRRRRRAAAVGPARRRSADDVRPPAPGAGARARPAPVGRPDADAAGPLRAPLAQGRGGARAVDPASVALRPHRPPAPGPGRRPRGARDAARPRARRARHAGRRRRRAARRRRRLSLSPRRCVRWRSARPPSGPARSAAHGRSSPGCGRAGSAPSAAR